MQAIETKYIGPTNYRGARIVARCDAGRVTIPYPYDLSGEEVHRAAADALMAKLGWNGTLCGGGTRNGYVFVFCEHRPKSMLGLFGKWRDITDAEKQALRETP